MDKIIFFNTKYKDSIEGKIYTSYDAIVLDRYYEYIDPCEGQVYRDFIDYAAKKTDYFMLVYKNLFGKGFTKRHDYFRKKLNRFKVKSRSNPSWPGTLGQVAPDTTYRVVFYKNTPEAIEVLKEVQGMGDWDLPNPEDLAFFKGNQCWFYSVGHEMIQGIIHADKEDLKFVEEKGLADIAWVEEYSSWYDQFDEEL